MRLRPGLIFKREAATGIRRLFIGPLLPRPLVRRELIPFVPDVPRCASRRSTRATSATRTGSRCGWIDLALSVPTMDTTRARRVLGWKPEHTSVQALLELLDGLRDAADFPTPPLAGRLRVNRRG